MVGLAPLARLIGAGALAWSLAACSPTERPTIVTGAAPAEQTAIAIGQDSAGEPCRVEPAINDNDALGASRVFDLRCGTWPRPSGRVVELPHPTDPAQLAGLAETGTWRGDIDQRLICERALDASILGATPAVWMRCTRRSGGLPHVAFVAAVGGKTYLCDGLPPSQSALEQAVGQLAGVVAAAASGPGQQSSAAELLEKQIGASAFGNTDVNQYDRLMQLGRGFNQERNYAQAEYYFREALALHQHLLGVDNPASAQPMMTLAVVLSNQQRFVDADKMFAKAASLIGPDADASVRALLMYYESLHQANQRHRDEALALAEQSRLLFASANGVTKGNPSAKPGDDLLVDPGASTVQHNDVQQVNLRVGEVQSGTLEADLKRRLNQVEESQKVITTIRKVAERSEQNVPEAVASVLEISGLNQVSLGSLAEGEEDLRAAIRHLDARFANTLPQARAYFVLGEVYVEQKRAVEALQLFRAGAKILRERNFTLPLEYVLPYLDVLYEEAGVGADGGQRDAMAGEMFEASQLARAGRAAQFISDAAAQLAQGKDDGANAIRELREQRQEIERLQSRIDDEASKPPAEQDSPRLNELAETLKTAQKHLDETQLKVQTLAPNFNLVRLQSVTAEGIQKVLRPDEAFYAVVLGPKTSYAFLVQPNAIRAFAVPLDLASAQDKVDHLRRAVKVTATGGFLDYDVAAAHALYTQLFGPVADQIAATKRLIVSQSGALLSLPFAMLVASPPDPVVARDYRKVDWMIRHIAISYVTSTQSFQILRQSETATRAPRPFIGFGDYVPPNAAQMEAIFPGDACSGDLSVLQQLGRLVGTAREIETVADIMKAAPDESYLGAQFTKARVSGLDLSRYRILHFATHGLLPTDLKCRTTPSMLMSLPETAQPNDVFFDTSDILKLKLNADLVVLSACNTASLGHLTSGDSLSGLAQSFFIAGARGLLVSHWLAADQSTVLLMTDMYRELAGGGTLGSAEALRRAQLSIIDEAGTGDRPMLFSHPLFWALFTLMGDGVHSAPSVGQPIAAAAAGA